MAEPFPVNGRRSTILCGGFAHLEGSDRWNRHRGVEAGVVAPASIPCRFSELRVATPSSERASTDDAEAASAAPRAASRRSVSYYETAVMKTPVAVVTPA